MKNLLETTHPRLTIGELADTVGSQPIRRSTHIGNQPPAELAVMAGLPPGIEVMMVDTIQADDRYSQPNILRTSGEAIQLVSRSKASKRVVGAVTVSQGDLIGQQLVAIHQTSLDQLSLNNPPVPMMELFSQFPDAVLAASQACLEMEDMHRIVLPDGKIVSGQSVDVERDGIYGLNGATTGALLPLNGMMVMDVLMSHEAGSNTTIHLGGPDMVRYTCDSERMSRVNECLGKSAAELGIFLPQHRLSVVDISGLAVIIPEQSQHELLETGRTIDLSEHFDKSCGISR